MHIHGKVVGTKSARRQRIHEMCSDRCPKMTAELRCGERGRIVCFIGIESHRRGAWKRVLTAGLLSDCRRPSSGQEDCPRHFTMQRAIRRSFPTLNEPADTPLSGCLGCNDPQLEHLGRASEQFIRRCFAPKEVSSSAATRERGLVIA